MDIIIGLYWFFLLVSGLKISVFMICSYRHNENNTINNSNDYQPLVSIIVPCYNESLTLSNCIKSLIKQSYKNFEIIIVNDGSKDNTKEVADQLSIVYAKEVKLLNKLNGGKASALNYGIKHSHGSIIVCVDADSIFIEHTLKHLVSSFNDFTVAAVGGNVKVSNREKILNKHQCLEYITGQNIQRRTFAYLGCMQIISGAIGAFRRDVLLEIGGYSSDTFVEDMDITIELAKRGHRVEFNSNAIAYTEAPENIKDFFMQRYRWVYGGFQVIIKHKEILFNKKFKEIGMVGLPYCLIFPWIDVIISILLICNVIYAIINKDFLTLLSLYFLIFMMQFGVNYYALSIDKEKKTLSLLSFTDSFWYPYLINVITIKAGINFILGKKTSWNKIQRLGKNINPTFHSQ